MIDMVPLDGALARFLGYGLDDCPFEKGRRVADAWRNEWFEYDDNRGVVVPYVIVCHGCNAQWEHPGPSKHADDCQYKTLRMPACPE